VGVFFERVQRASVFLGRLVSQLYPLMILLIFAVVVLRYFFDAGWIWLQEAILWIHALIFLLVAPYALEEDAHVRVDVFYRQWSKKTQALINLLGALLFLCPFSLFLFYSSLDYIFSSWIINEASRDAGGMPYPFISLLKSTIPLTALLLFLQGLSMSYLSISKLKND
jgi:TRAP-type mannitol/chloroaromatic compound transport system permease small subunit